MFEAFNIQDEMRIIILTYIYNLLRPQSSYTYISSYGFRIIFYILELIIVVY